MTMPGLKSNHIVILSIIYNVCHQYPDKRAPKTEILKNIKDIPLDMQNFLDLKLEPSGLDYIFSQLFMKKYNFIISETMNTEGQSAKHQVLYSMTNTGEDFLKKYCDFLHYKMKPNSQ